MTATGRASSSGSAANATGAKQTLAAAARLFDIEHDHAAIQEHLQRSKPLRQRLNNLPGMRPLGAWSPFELCLRTILGQQVSVRAALHLAGKLVAELGTPLEAPTHPGLTHAFPAPERFEAEDRVWVVEDRGEDRVLVGGID